MNTERRYKIWMTVTAVLIVFSAAAALCMGQFRIPLDKVIAELTGRGSDMANAHTVLFQIRIPRILLSMLAGAGLAVSGAAFQSLFSNPMATPDTLGTANGASFGAALGILLGFGAFRVQLTALVFGISAVMLVFAVTRSASGQSSPSMIMVILGGMVISSLFSALTTLIKFVADPQDVLPVITFWLMGSFSSTTQKSFLYGSPLIIAGTAVICLLRYRLNALSLSEDEARSLGVNLPLVRGLVIASASAVTASVVAMCGVIGWVGLLVPHIARMVLGNDNSRVVPASVTFGALFMLVVDTIARCAASSEIPVSVLTAVIGAPVFILLLRRSGGIGR
ncbi:MAG: iron ABC transporter permease [Solobacterium sp.]|nr:iron ABC transporter permease [Solobacterium sp.]